MDDMPPAQDVLDGKLSTEELHDLNTRLATVMVKETVIKPLLYVAVFEAAWWGIKKYRHRQRP